MSAYSTSYQSKFNRSHDENGAFSSMASQAEARDLSRRTLRYESRRRRFIELERRAAENELRTEKTFMGDSIVPKMSYSTAIAEDSARFQLNELQDKYQQVMMTNAALENEKQTLKYHVDLLTDELRECEESQTVAESVAKQKSHDLKMAQHLNAEQTKSLAIAQHQISQRDQLIADHNLMVLEPDQLTYLQNKNVKVEDTQKSLLSAALIPTGVYQQLQRLPESAGPSFAEKVLFLISHFKNTKEILEEKTVLESSVGQQKREIKLLEDQIQTLQLSQSKKKEELFEKPKNSVPVEIVHALELQIRDLKLKTKALEADLSTVQGSHSRLEAQMKRSKDQTDRLENSETELKTEVRRLKREIREAGVMKEELEQTNSHLRQRLDKMRSIRPSLSLQGSS